MPKRRILRSQRTQFLRRQIIAWVVVAVLCWAVLRFRILQWALLAVLGAWLFSYLAAVVAGVTSGAKKARGQRAVGRGVGKRRPDANLTLRGQTRTLVGPRETAAWRQAANEGARGNGLALVELARLAEIQGIARRARLTLKQSESLAVTAEIVGLRIEPDVRLVRIPYAWDDLVALLPPQAESTSEGASQFPAAAIMLRLGMFIAAADGAPQTEELRRLASFLEKRFQLLPQEVQRIEALQVVYRERPPGIAGTSARLKATLSPEERETLAQFLVELAGANRLVEDAELAALRGAFKALGIETSQASIWVERLQKGRWGLESTDGRTPLSTPAGQPFTLDEETLRRKLAETLEVGAILSKAMRVEEDQGQPDASPQATRAPQAAAGAPPNAAAPKPADRPDDSRLEGLEARHQALLAELLTKNSWPKLAFEALVRNHGLMPAGAVDTINEWSIEKNGDILIDPEADPIPIASTLLDGRS